jgi:acylpyruvate hydrolase
MRLAKYTWKGLTAIGVVEDGRVFPSDAETMPAALAASMAGTLARNGEDGIDLGDVRLEAPVDPASKILAVALNYSGHIRETGQSPPENPILFFKAHESMIGGEAPIAGLGLTGKLDYEGELAVLIGRECYQAEPEEAWQYIAGISAFNDTSARDLLRVKAGDNIMFDWFSSKCLNRATALGPVVVGFDEVEAPLRAGELEVITRVNGSEVQRAMTGEMIFGIPELIAFITSRVALSPGDVIATGTPQGVGAATGSFLGAGDVVEIDIAPIPVLRNVVAAE